MSLSCGAVSRLFWSVCAGAALFVVGCGSSEEAASHGTSGSGGASSTGAGGAASTTSTGGQGQGSAGGVQQPKLGPPYPIVLAHGFFGFENFAGTDFLTYFYQVKEHLASEGELVYTPAVDPFNDSDFRGAQLVESIEAILAETGHEKVNIIGHSQGGLDARAVAAMRPDLVASVVTVATPHGGSPVADIVLELVSDPNAQEILAELIKIIGAPLYDKIGEETDVIKPLKLFSKPGIEEFNQKHPDQPGVFYASVGGRTDYKLHGPDCVADVELQFIKDYENTLDPVDTLMSVTEAAIDGGFGDPFPNDGLVRVVDSKRGEFWGCVPADHLDEVGQLFGDSAGSGNKWNYLQFYSGVVRELRQRGY
jgi:triacylglycerol lipase